MANAKGGLKQLSVSFRHEFVITIIKGMDCGYSSSSSFDNLSTALTLAFPEV